jgi:hypothetical protein
MNPNKLIFATVLSTMIILVAIFIVAGIMIL